MESQAELNRVGILLIHGIGEQSQFEHLEEVVRNVATALDADKAIKGFTVCVNSSKDSAYRARQQTWKADGTATAFIDVEGGPENHPTRLEFREVWWADLDEPTSLATALSFWGWALSLWSQQFGMGKGGKIQHPSMEPLPLSEPPKSSLRVRIYLFLVSLVVFLLFPLLWLIGKLLNSILGFNIKPDVLVDFLGDVKLYQQPFRTGMGPLVELGRSQKGGVDHGEQILKAPPRFSIRRRVISAMVEMCMEDYPRWYVLSHSLGTVCACNGLMEADIALPRYLDEKLWQRWCAWCRQKNVEVKRNLSDGEKKAQAKALPLRPSWLSVDHTDFIDRQALFNCLEGFLTYGSPISKFARLWPVTVPLNTNTSVFRSSFEWVNVFDPTDPVANYILPPKNHGNQVLADLNLQEIPYKAAQLHLLSHTQYLAFDANRKNPLIAVVTRWLLSGDKFQSPVIPTDSFVMRLGWPTPATNKRRFAIDSFYYYLGILCWLLLAAVISTVLSWFLPSFLAGIPAVLAMSGITDFSSTAPSLQSLLCLPNAKGTEEALCLIDWSDPISYIAVSFLLITVFGMMAWLFRSLGRGTAANS